MVHNPKNSQKMMLWCMETAIDLVFKGVEFLGEKLSSSTLKQYFTENTYDYNLSSKQISQTIYDLKRRKYIDFGDGDSVILTNKAKIKIVDKIIENKRSDGKFRLVSFDIPESRRLCRDKFRFTIKRMGFRQIQKSLWVCDRNIGDLVELAIAEYGVADYVAYFVIEKSNIDNHMQDLIHKKLVKD